MNIAALLSRQAADRPDSIALIDARGGDPLTYTYSQLEDAVALAAGWLRAKGVRRGDRVLVLVPIAMELYVLLLALWRLEASAVIVDPGAGRPHVARCCARVKPDVLLGIPAALAFACFVAPLRAIPRKLAVRARGSWLPWPWVPRWELAAGTELVRATNREEGAMPALLTFTSGSTGEPKVAVRTHAFLVAQDAALRPALALEPGEVDLITLPVFVFANLAAGVTSLLPDLDLKRPGAIDGESAARQIARFGVTRCTASPAFFARLAESTRVRGTTLPGLRKLFTGGAPVFPALLDSLRAAAPNAQVDAVYGSTEAEPIAHFAAAGLGAEERATIQRGGGLPAGIPVPEISVRILPDAWGTPRPRYSAGQFESLALRTPEAIGEIVVSGPHVLSGYLEGRGDEETKFRVENTVWHRTGDAGYFDGRGRLWLLGRCGAKIDDAVGRLYPFAVEAAAMAAAADIVVRAALVAIEGRRVLAVQLKPGAQLPAGFADDRLSWAELDEVRELACLPVDRRHNAKIDYPALRRLLG